MQHSQIQSLFEIHLRRCPTVEHKSTFKDKEITRTVHAIPDKSYDLWKCWKTYKPTLKDACGFYAFSEDNKFFIGRSKEKK